MPAGSDDMSTRPLADAEAGQRLQQTFHDAVEPEIAVLLRVARSMLPSEADAEDLVQETLIRAFRGLARFDGRHPRAWLLTILRNTNRNMHRRERPLLADDWVLGQASRPAFGAAGVPSAEDSVLSEALDADLAEAVERLDLRFRSVLILVDVHDLSYAEAAAVLGIPVGTVMSRLSRARDRIRKALQAELAQQGESP